VSRFFLNGTSVQLGYTVPFTFDVPKETYNISIYNVGGVPQNMLYVISLGINNILAFLLFFVAFHWCK